MNPRITPNIRAAVLGAAACLIGLITPGTSQAALPPLIYQSATYGGSFQGGYNISTADNSPTTQWVGARFEVTSPVLVTAIGGNLSITDPPEQLFGALIQLTGPGDFPDSADLSTADVLAHVEFTPPGADGFSTDTVIPIGPVALAPGTYAVLYGSGLFGAAGYGHLPGFSQTAVGTPSFFGFGADGTNYYDSNHESQPARLTVYGQVPEPASFVLLAVGGLMIAGRPWSKRRSLKQVIFDL